MFQNSNAIFTIETTTYCNANCTMCQRDSFRYPQEHMTAGLFKKAVDETTALGVKKIALCLFGEPLLDPNIAERIRYIKTNYPASELSLVTTAYFLRDEIRDVVVENIDILKISNCGITKETYEKVHRGSLKYEIAKQNIDEYLKLEKRPYTILAYTVTPDNEAEIQSWKEYYGPKCDRIDIWQPHNWAGATQTDNTGKPVKTCWRAITLSAPIIRANGDISVCCFDYNHELVIGDLKKDSLYDILNGDGAMKIKTIHKTKDIANSNTICKNCDQCYDRSDALIYSSDESFDASTTSHRRLK